MKLVPPFQNYVFARGGEAGQQVCTRALGPFNGMMEYANLRIGTATRPCHNVAEVSINTIAEVVFWLPFETCVFEHFGFQRRPLDTQVLLVSI